MSEVADMSMISDALVDQGGLTVTAGEPGRVDAGRSFRSFRSFRSTVARRLA
jgi:hypothetical protein